MDYEKACAILGVAKTDSLDIIKKKYRALILKTHPDKALLGGTNQAFIEIHEAYHHILSLDTESAAAAADNAPPSNITMQDIIVLFWKNPAVYALLTNMLISVWENNLPGYLKKLDTTNLKKIHQAIAKYFPGNACSSCILQSIEKALEEKTESLVILNPNLDDLLDSNIYKLKMNGETYLVPLWHNELVYGSGKNDSAKEIIIQCCPLLEQNMEIDDNVLTVYLSLDLREVFNNPCVKIDLTNKHAVAFDGRQLKLTGDCQYVRLKGGIAAINEKNIYEIEVKKDIVLGIYLQGG